MKKRLSLVLASVIGVTTLLTGCNLFQMNTKAYYEQPVATVAYNSNSAAANITITKEDLMQAYTKYGSTLSQNGYSGQELVDYLVDLLVDQAIIYNEVEALIDAGQITLTNNDKNDVWQQTYDNMLNLLKDYEKNVVEDWKLPEASSPEVEEETKTEFTPYQSKARIVFVDDEWKIEIIDNENQDQDPLLFDENEGYVPTVIEKLDQYVAESNVAKEAKQRYIYDLKNFQKGRGFSTDNDKVWEREVNRVYEGVLENKYLTLYTDYLQSSHATAETEYSVVSVNDVFKYLESQVTVDYLKYTSNLTTLKDDMLGNRKDVYYIPTQNAEKFFYVSHILVKFDEEQFKQLDAALESGSILKPDYDAARADLVAQTCAKEYGKTVEGYTVQMLYDDFKAAMNSANNVQTKMDVFNEFMYKYNEDTGNKNQDFDYVIGTENSQMVESFTQAARDLYNNGNGQIGAISEMVESEYGIHILVYLGEAENWFNVADINTFSLSGADNQDIAESINKITTTKLSQLNSKTIFDMVYEKLATDTVSILEILNLNSLKHNLTITTYASHYADLY